MIESVATAVGMELAKLALKNISTALLSESGQWGRIAEVDKAFYKIFPPGSQVVLVVSGYVAKLHDFDYDDRCTGVKDAIALMSLSGYLAKAKKVTVSVYDHEFAKSQENLLREHLILTGSPPFNSVADLVLKKCIPSEKLSFEFKNRTILFGGEPKNDSADTIHGVIACTRNSITPEVPVSKKALLFAGVHQLGTHLAINYFMNRDVQRAIRPLVSGKREIQWAILVRGGRKGLEIQNPVAEGIAHW